ncbi:nucleotidyltransferase family protein [Methanoregula sp.]|uniref:nucleotidyltransferase family protein n=1 Tax=Methanoregula sp. TaxID=2052170 RepID=UPI000CBB63E9|nr:nucleotidyltransferase family protein [Methanoregula sp.]PKG31599.1 MAG: nucleotidyltransferase [Methanoregula sp.]
MATKSDVLRQLKRLKPELAAKYDIKEISLFGSVAREEEDSLSDIDLLVEFGDQADLVTYIGLWQYLEDSIGTKIDLVSKRALTGEMRDKVMRDRGTV